MQCMVLKMLTDFTLMYNACVGVILKRDAEGLGPKGGSPPVTPSVKSGQERQLCCKERPLQARQLHMPRCRIDGNVPCPVLLSSTSANSVLIEFDKAMTCSVACRHVMHTHLPVIPSSGASWQSMSEQTAMFLVAVCIR